MSIYKKVTLRRGPCDGWIVDVATNVSSAAFRYMPPQGKRITGLVSPPSTPCNSKIYELRYDFAYNDYNGPVFTYRDRHGLLAEEWQNKPCQPLSCNERLAQLVALLRSYLDVAVLEATTRGDMLTLIWRWRINGQEYQYGRRVEVALFALRNFEVSLCANLLHLAFLAGVGRLCQPSTKTDETKSVLT